MSWPVWTPANDPYANAPPDPGPYAPDLPGGLVFTEGWSEVAIDPVIQLFTNATTQTLKGVVFLVNGGGVASLYSAATPGGRAPRQFWTVNLTTGSTIQQASGLGATGQGIYHSMYFGAMNTGVGSTHMGFFGLMAPVGGTIAPPVQAVNPDPTTFVNCIGVAWLPGVANLIILHNDAAGVPTQIDTGIAKPAAVANTRWFRFEVGSDPLNSGNILSYALREIDGALFTGEINTNLPDPTVGLLARWQNAAASSAGIVVTSTQGSMFSKRPG